MRADGHERRAGRGGHVRLEIDGHLAWVTLSHPGRLNAITVGMWGELRAVFDQLAADNALRCVIVRGEGGNFAAGADIREFPAERADMAGVQRYHREVLAPALAAVAACPHPVVAQIEGACAWAADWRSPASATCASPARPRVSACRSTAWVFRWRPTRCAA